MFFKFFKINGIVDPRAKNLHSLEMVLTKYLDKNIRKQFD
jgi:hypothetical protein